MRFGPRRVLVLCLALLLLLASLTTIAVLFRRREQSYRMAGSLPPVSFWYWHTPFALTPNEIKTLHDLGVQELFVRTATLTYSGDPNDPVRAILRQKWPPQTPVKSANPVVRIHLVFPVDSTLVRRFESLPEPVFARSVAQAIQSERQRAVAQTAERLVVVGVQIDLDCPTRLLPRYAAVLKELRPHLNPADTLSITLLTSWYDSRTISGLLDRVDFSVPQFYEAQTSTTRNQFHPVSDLARLSRGLKQAERLGKPFFVGLPIYGHALVYDNKERLRGLFHDAAAADLLGRPQDFRFLGAAPLDRNGNDAATRDAFIGEERVEFGPAREKATAFRLTYDLPTPELLRRHLALLRETRLPFACRGIILYRFPERNQEAVLPLATVTAALRGDTLAPNLHIQFRTRRTAPYDLVESPGSAPPPPPRTDLYVTVVNDGTSPVRVAPDAVEVVLHFQHTVLESVRPGGFERVEGFAGTPGNRASITRAEGLRLFTTHLAPGERRIIGPITLLPATSATATVDAQWRVVLPGGFNTLRGTVPPTPLAPEEVK